MAFSDEVTADAPVLSWILDETSGTTAADFSGNGLDGTYYGSPSLGVTGLVTGNASASFDGVDDRCQREGAGDILTATSALSVEVWIETTAMPPGWTWFASVRGASPYLTLELTDTGTIWVTLQSVAPATGSLEGPVISDGARHHVVVTWDNATQIMTLYVDGAPFDSTPALGDASPLPTFDQAAVGDDPDPTPSGPTEGVFGWFSVYGTALSDARVAAHFAAADVTPPEEATPEVNRAGSWVRDNIGQARWEPPVSPPVAAIYPQNVVVAQAYTAPTVVGTQVLVSPTYAREPAHRDRIIIAGRDVTYFRGAPTPTPDWQLIQPLLWGAATIELPQVAVPFEQPGHGALSWLKPGVSVRLQRVDVETNEVIAEQDYRGIVVAFGISGGNLTVECGGHASGRAALLDRQMRLIQQRVDAGTLCVRAIKSLRLRHSPPLRRTTGIELIDWGGGGMLDYINELVAKMTTVDGDQWTVMPDANAVYRTTLKDLDTIHGTVYPDDARVTADLRRDIAEEPNRIFASGVTPNGMVVKFGAYPGLIQAPAPAYPFNDNATFGVGTTDADTDTGEGITVMGWRLFTAGYLEGQASYSTFTSAMATAIRELRRRAGLANTGDMNPAAWRALFDLSVTGYDLRNIRILPAAQDAETKPWRLSASGGLIDRNPAYDPSAIWVDRTIAMGAGFTKSQIRQWARLALHDGEVWRGTIEIGTGAIVAGDHTPGDPITAILRSRDIEPGMNLSLPLFAGGIVVHVAGVSFTNGGQTATLAVSTQPGDTLPVWAAIQRDRDNRNTVHRSFFAQRRSADLERENTIDEVGGTIEPITLDPDNWTVFPVVAKQAGTIEKLHMRLSPAREFVVAVFGRKISPKRLRRVTNAPLTKAGRERWTEEAVYDALNRDHVVLYVAGSDEDPCGYFPGRKSEGASLLTGRWEDDASFPFVTFANDTDRGSVLWVAVWVGASAKLQGGRIMWPSAEEY